MMITPGNRCTRAIAALFAYAALSGCTDMVEGLTSHARPVAVVDGEPLEVQELGRMMADSEVPDSALTGFWAASVARLWADYVLLIRVYQEPDSTESLDYDTLLDAGRYYSVLEVQRYRDSVILAGIEPTASEVREYFDTSQPLTRLDVRRIVLTVPEAATESARDSLFQLAEGIRERVVGGADFVATAREFSHEPAAARGQTLAYQGHEDFPAIADTVVYRLRPGEISPVFATGDEMVLYRVERRRAPEFESVREIIETRMIDERRYDRLSAASDSLLEGSRRVVADGAESLARAVASDGELAQRRIAGSTRLVRFEGGEFTVDELRQLFRARPDLQRRFVQELDDEAIAVMLYQLAGDEILITAAAESGVELSPEAREGLRQGIGRQLAAIARRWQVSHAAAASPRFNVAAESRRFLTSTLERARPVPWLTEFRLVLDPVYPNRVDEASAEVAARIARERRAGDGVDEEAHGTAEAHD